MSTEAVSIQMLVNMLIAVTGALINTFQIRHTTWMEFALSYQFRFDDKGISQRHDDLCNGDLPLIDGNWLLHILR
jgi:hypothetical protein